jgi:azurin
MKAIRTIACLSLVLAAPGVFAADKVCKVDISSTDQMTFDKKEIAVAADCVEVEVTLHHVGKMPAAQMGHNWVLSKTADAQTIANDGLAAGMANDHIKKGDARVIAHTKIIGGGQTATVKFPTSALQKGGAYTFFCSFPGHIALMKGTLKFG